MDFDWDEEKDAANRVKHGVSLGDAVRLDWEARDVSEDQRADYGETRFVALAPLAGRIHVCIYTMRAGRVRVISLRKANSREVSRYEQVTKG